MNYDLIFRNSETNEIFFYIYLEHIDILAGMLLAWKSLKLYFPKTYVMDSRIPVDRIYDSYIVYDNIIEENINILNRYLTEDNLYYLWIKSDKMPYYTLIQLNNSRFMQGFISMCNHFNSDFRNYIYGYLFDANNNKYILANYIMVPYNIYQYPFDMIDVDEEEEDNENILHPDRTGEIITLKDFYP